MPVYVIWNCSSANVFVLWQSFLEILFLQRVYFELSTCLGSFYGNEAACFIYLYSLMQFLFVCHA